MKTSELKKIVEDNKFIFVNDDELPKLVAQAILGYAYTPLVEREEEEKRYILIFPSCFDEFKYLNFNNITKKYGRSMQSFVSLNDIKTIFTQKEIDAMPFDTNFFIKEEVK